jgi:hypothetical protein
MLKQSGGLKICMDKEHKGRGSIKTSPSLKMVYMFWLWEGIKPAVEVFKNRCYERFLAQAS